MVSPSTSAFAVAITILSAMSVHRLAAADSTADLVKQLSQDLSADMTSQPVVSASRPGHVPVSPAHAKAGEPLLPLESRGGDRPMVGHLGKRSCGAEPLSMKEMAMQEVHLASAARLMNSEDGKPGSGLGMRDTTKYGPQVKQVNVYWHVIMTGSQVSQGNLPRSAIIRQMKVLNQKYQRANIRFKLAGVDYTKNKGWYHVKQGSQPDNDMRRALHFGSMKDLNVYSAAPRGTAGDLIAGYTKMPQYAQLEPTLDGSVILHTTLPGGSEIGFNMGLTLVHEVGHAFGLMHPFDHGCQFPGDAIGDTPYQREAIYDCTPQKTCVHRPGQSDPIHNPMGYAPDACMKAFTGMQTKKMRKAWYAYRYTSK